MSAYLLGNLIFILAWVILYFTKPSTKKLQLFGSFLLLPFALLDIWFRPNYWNPPLLIKAIEPLSLETMIYCFTAGGIAIVFGNLFIKKTINFNPKWSSILIFLFSSFVLYFFFRAFFHLSEMNNLNFSFLLVWLVLLFKDHRYFKENIKSTLPGLMLAVFTIVAINTALPFFPNFVEKYWNLSNMWPLFFNTPADEIFFAGVLGVLWTVLPKYLIKEK